MVNQVAKNDTLEQVSLDNQCDEKVLEYYPSDCKYALLILLSGVMINISVTAMSDTYGIYNTYYLAHYSNEKPSKIGLIGTVGIGLMLLFPIFLGVPIHYLGYRAVVWIGGTIAALGLIVASFCTEIWQLILSHGLIFGIGASMPFFCSYALVSLWFKKYQGIAMGVVNSGSGMGGIIYPLVKQKLFSSVGIPWTLRISAIYIFTCVLLSGIVIKRRVSKSKEASMMELRAVADPFILLVGTSAFLNDLAYTGPIFYFPTILQDRGYTFSESLIFPLCTNIGAMVGSILMGLFSFKIGEINTVLISIATLSIIVPVFWLTTTNPTPLLVLGFFYGFFYAAIHALFPAIIGRYYHGPRSTGLISVIFLFVASGTVLGGPVNGGFFEISEKIKSSYPLALFFSCTLVASFTSLTLAQFCIKKRIASRKTKGDLI